MKTRQEKCVPILVLLALLAGSLTAAGQASNATPVQASAASAQPANSAIIGEWQGAISRLRLTVKIEQAGDGPLKGALTSLDQGNLSISIDEVSFKDGALRLDMKSIGATYEGKLSADGAEISGTWQQSGQSIALLLHRPGATPTRVTLKPRSQGRIPLEPCRTKDGNTEALCGTYDVYENRESRQGRKIALNIMLLPATADKPAQEPFFALAGGPGQSATEAFPPAGFVTKMRQQRDVVLVDQRGTGKSNLLQCSLLPGDDAQSLIAEPFSLDKIRECRAESDKNADPTQYTTSIAADDLDEVRQAMGYEKIHVFGGSYGSKAALVYLRRHGDQVATLTVEAVAGPQYRIPLPFAKATQSAVDRLIDHCAADAACHKAYPDLRREFNTIIERLDKSPAKFEVRGQPVTMSREMFVSKLRPLLYFPEVQSAFPLVIHHAYQGNWSGYGGIVVALSKQLEGATARGASMAAVCAEDVPGLTDSVIRRETKGTYLGDSQVHRYQAYCKAWGRAGAIPKDFYEAVRSKVPTLLIAGALDPATPPEMAEQAARDLTNSRVIAVKEGTHGTGSSCIDGLIAEFVKQGSPSGLDASCADQIHLPPFLPNPDGK
jgi:pimeloyl-ACP methyl ester carboxylesterase